MKMLSTATLLSGLALIAPMQTAHAFSFPLADESVNQNTLVAPLVDESSAIDFTSIIALSNCSGSFVKFTTSKADDYGMVLTNGHCYEDGFIDAGQALVDIASNRSLRLLSADARSTVAVLRASRIMYATMTGTDVTLYRLTETFAEIKARYNVDPLVISDARPVAGAPLHIVSGYWKRIYTCQIDDFVPALNEDQWTFTDSIRYTKPGCETIGGTSGSPIIHSDTREVIGINNTGNENGGRCTLNNPCEVDANGGISVRAGASYGQQLYQIYGCLNETNQIDLAIEGCTLTGASPASN